MDVENADCIMLNAALTELSVNWTKDIALAGSVPEGQLYQKIRKAIKDRCGEDYVIRQNSVGGYSVVDNV
jgi:hypothetical protein